jgi:methylmalonyl-CoA mutase N-terminal domain/subunit
MMRFHCQTAGVSLMAPQPMNNVVRVAYQALAAVLAGAQSLHTNSLDETYALPTEESVRLALRTQQILAHETGVPNVIDPLGGSYFLEALTDRMEREAEAVFAEIARQGGVVRGIETGWFQQQIAQSARRFQHEVEQKRRIIVGVNHFQDGHDDELQVLRIGASVDAHQRRRLAELRTRRDGVRVRACLDELRAAAERDDNVIPAMLDCARAYGTLYEIRQALEEVYGAYREPVFF